MAKRPPWVKKGAKDKPLPPHKTDGRIKERPWSTPEEFDALVDQYFEKCRESFADKERPTEYPTKEGLYLHLGFSGYRSFTDYIITRAGQNYIECWERAETLVSISSLNVALATNGAGAIFHLKNLGFSDKQEVKLSGKVEKVVREIVRPDDPDG